MSKQQTFDKVAAHLRQQQAVSEDPNGDCLYRGPNGLKCAIGALIPDNMYSADFEGQSADKIAWVLDQLGHDVDLCIDLQHVHDWEDVAYWNEALESVADRHGLTFTKE